MQLVARRRQLIDLRTMESNRLEQTTARAAQKSIRHVLKLLDKEIDSAGSGDRPAARVGRRLARQDRAALDDSGRRPGHQRHARGGSARAGTPQSPGDRRAGGRRAVQRRQRPSPGHTPHRRRTRVGPPRALHGGPFGAALQSGRFARSPNAWPPKAKSQRSSSPPACGSCWSWHTDPHPDPLPEGEGARITKRRGGGR